ncbi:dihydrodipicolinate reductase [Hydrogenispora ethanolica]|jgi:4-hydroxy-tetrahydrodipicolinate reductase|uniref:4-hydroxy-tetrahydrodipicolinate reductase n=1 Tax=Hydrogenispora ethanolica TaxID=1082276 RepID=A0A4R1S740_HYDET|nr:4-hydroxy-tetrahydrodipicolinate reductase [Hydrogenispora ethanolica]TCL75185.1 dihydrodipicolinate reductase [Hydrogenispora ethanolica]
MTRVCLVGLGRTGIEVAKAIMEQKDLRLVSAISSPNSRKIGKDLGEILGCPATGVIVQGPDQIEPIVFQSRPDVVVDFTNPAATVRNSKLFSKMKVNIVVGTTGFSKIAMYKLYVLTKKYHNAILYAPNITLGVNVMMLLTNLAANMLNNYDFQITEIHHKHKKDAPSGTAVKIAKEIEKGLAASGLPETADVPIQAIRAGGVVGKHEVLIVGENDRIEISHESFSRKAFALGAIKGIRFIQGKSGYFEMNDVLNLQKVLGDYLAKEKFRNKRQPLYRMNSAAN